MKWLFSLLVMGALVGCGSSGDVSSAQEQALHKKLGGPPNARNRGAGHRRNPNGPAAGTAGEGATPPTTSPGA
jgi:hypothetical protein